MASTSSGLAEELLDEQRERLFVSNDLVHDYQHDRGAGSLAQDNTNERQAFNVEGSGNVVREQGLELSSLSLVRALNLTHDRGHVDSGVHCLHQTLLLSIELECGAQDLAFAEQLRDNSAQLSQRDLLVKLDGLGNVVRRSVNLMQLPQSFLVPSAVKFRVLRTRQRYRADSSNFFEEKSFDASPHVITGLT